MGPRASDRRDGPLGQACVVGGDLQTDSGYPFDPAPQFLVEAIVISLFGGLLGIGLGYILSDVLERTLEWPTSIPTNAIAMAFGFAAATGVFFGFYPARKAARLDPIEALRFE